ncbi:MAG TPA: hypothetical protein PLL20_08410 [Phycisphaerae bacterium]|jgi:glutathione S-transferase|nr:hypothetical protein [Phycisphaerae bacterium]HRR84422.1 hypothetical protein [Phycisphaerae bacterium]
MSFQNDVEQTAGLEHAYRPGKQALRPADQNKVDAIATRRLAGSADIDAALENLRPNENRWDYVVGWATKEKSEFLYWIEVHSASGAGAVREILDKLTWLKGWLDGEGNRLRNYRRKIVWIASGKSAFQQNSPQLKRLVAAGVYFAGGHYTIAD